MILYYIIILYCPQKQNTDVHNFIHLLRMSSELLFMDLRINKYIK